ncbi:hypothetical protein GQ600_22248 [Phytophthora cactorum]|nr:hypothetical protein GQ600_22248 [Phytophthora cactorum]
MANLPMLPIGSRSMMSIAQVPTRLASPPQNQLLVGVERLAEAAIPHDRRQVELHGEVGGHGVATKHCWHIPVDGSERMAC